MEASGAGLAAASGDGAADGGGEQQQSEGQDFGQIAQQLTEGLTGLSSGQDELRAMVEAMSQAQQPQEDQQEEQPLPDLSVFDENRPGYSDQQAAQALQELMRTEAGQALQEALSPLQEQLSDIQMDRENDKLIAKYPDLGNDETAKAVVDTAQRWAAAMNDPKLVQNPAFIEMTYLAGRAAELAKQQQDGAAEGAVATLEGAGGARPGGAGQGADPAEALKERWAQGGNVLSRL